MLCHSCLPTVPTLYVKKDAYFIYKRWKRNLNAQIMFTGTNADIGTSTCMLTKQ